MGPVVTGCPGLTPVSIGPENGPGVHSPLGPRDTSFPRRLSRENSSQTHSRLVAVLGNLTHQSPLPAMTPYPLTGPPYVVG